jgi:hypothetical protein
MLQPSIHQIKEGFLIYTHLGSKLRKIEKKGFKIRPRGQPHF